MQQSEKVEFSSCGPASLIDLWEIVVVCRYYSEFNLYGNSSTAVT